MMLHITKEEAGVLIQLLDAAVRASGLNYAEAAAVFARRIDEAAMQEIEEERKTKEQVDEKKEEIEE